MAYRVNGKTYIGLAQAAKAAQKIFEQTGNVVAVEKSERGIFKPVDPDGGFDAAGAIDYGKKLASKAQKEWTGGYRIGETYPVPQKEKRT